MNLFLAISYPGCRNAALSDSANMSSAQCKCFHFPNLSNLNGVFSLSEIMGPSGCFTVGNPDRDTLSNQILARP